MKLNRYLIISYNDIIFLLLEKDLFPSWEDWKRKKICIFLLFVEDQSGIKDWSSSSQKNQRESARERIIKIIFSSSCSSNSPRKNHQILLSSKWKRDFPISKYTFNEKTLRKSHQERVFHVNEISHHLHQIY